MKLLWITSRRLDEDGCANTQRGAAAALAARGWTIEWVAPAYSSGVGEVHRAHRSRRTGRGATSFRKSVKQVLGKLELSEYNVAIVEWQAVSGAYQALSDAGIPFVVMDRSPPVASGIIGALQRIEYKLAWKKTRKFAFGVCAKSQALANSLASRVKGLPMAIMPAGVDVNTFHPIKNAGSDATVIVCHGSMDKVRRLDSLVGVVSAARSKTGKDLRLRLFGAGANAAVLRAMARNRPWLEVLPSQKQAVVPNLVNSADIGVMALPNKPVWRFASPLKVAEFAASGLPVISSDVAGLAAYAEQDWLRLTSLGDDAAVLNALCELVALDSQTLNRLGDEARNAAIANMTWTTTTTELHELLCSAAAISGV